MGSNLRKVKTKIIKLFFVACQLSTQQQGVRAKTGWLGIRIMYLSGATFIPEDYCFSELVTSIINIQLNVLV